MSVQVVLRVAFYDSMKSEKIQEFLVLGRPNPSPPRTPIDPHHHADTTQALRKQTIMHCRRHSRRIDNAT